MKKTEAFLLRREGKSYNEISKALNISKSSISHWFKNINWSENLKKELTQRAKKITTEKLNNFRKTRWEKFYTKARKEAIKEFPKLIKNPLFIAGVMLYWGEGDNKSKTRLSFTNTDPRMVKIFFTFLKKILRIKKNKLTVSLILYPDLREKTCKEFWITEASLQSARFVKTQYIQGRHKARKLNWGICMLNFSDGYNKEKIRTWIDLFSKNTRMK